VPVPRRFDRRPPERDLTRINEKIRVPEVRLVGADGQQIGVVPIDDALSRARDQDLDLVEVAPDAKPPVARLLDYSKYKYEQEQKAKAARRHQQEVNVREIKFRPKIADHDYETKKGHVMRFLKQKDKVKVTIMFRGREQAHPERGRMLLARLFDDLDDLAMIEQQPEQEGRNMTMMLAPLREGAAKPGKDKVRVAGTGPKPGPAVAAQPAAQSSDAQPAAEATEAAESGGSGDARPAADADEAESPADADDAGTEVEAPAEQKAS
jgi:translation initiation factor IF-3